MPDLNVIIRDEQLNLLPERAIYWPRHEAMIIADLHFGKAATFRAAGMPLPDGHLNADLARLTQAMQRTGAKKLWILGDFLHARRGRDSQTLDAIAHWRNTYNDWQIMLLRGNHDLSAGDPPGEWSIICVDDPVICPPFVFRHDPQAHASGYVLGGHVHPMVGLHRAGTMLKLPCFWFSPGAAVLPPFGSFIDGTTIRPKTGDKLYVIADDTVIAMR